MAINFKEIFGKVVDTTLGVLGDAAASALKKTPEVQGFIKQETAKQGGQFLWAALPFAVGGFMLVMLLKFKS